MAIPELDNFYLVGGTCLSLRYGHRKSIDLDLFSTSGFEIDDVKVDLVKYHYFEVIGTPVIEDGIRMFSDKDIIAMKIFAILKRAQKKDFWDLAELLKHYTINDLINYYNQKYPNHQLPISIPHAITYFTDADESEDPVSLKGQTWAGVKKEISQKVSDYLR